MDRHDRPRFRILIVALLALLCACSPRVIIPDAVVKMPQQEMQAQADSAFCGAQLKAEPKSEQMQRAGVAGVWVSEKRYKCLSVRQRGFLVCKKECGKAMDKNNNFALDLLRKQKQRHQIEMQAIHRQITTLKVAIIASTVGAFVLGSIITALILH